MNFNLFQKKRNRRKKQQKDNKIKKIDKNTLAKKTVCNKIDQI